MCLSNIILLVQYRFKDIILSFRDEIVKWFTYSSYLITSKLWFIIIIWRTHGWLLSACTCNFIYGSEDASKQIFVCLSNITIQIPCKLLWRHCDDFSFYMVFCGVGTPVFGPSIETKYIKFSLVLHQEYFGFWLVVNNDEFFITMLCLSFAIDIH